MALIKLSSVVTAASGKIGGVVFARNRGGSYARSWAKGVNTNTPTQALQKARLTEVTQQWRNLTDGQRLSWTNAASERWHQVNNRLGEAVTQSGFQYFLKSNMAGATVGAPLLQAPVGPVALPSFKPPVATLAQGDGLEFEAAWNELSPDPGTNVQYIIRINRPTPVGRKVKADRILAVGAPGTGNFSFDPVLKRLLFDMEYDALVAKFGEYPVGSQLIMSLQAVSTTHPWDVLAESMDEGTTVRS